MARASEELPVPQVTVINTDNLSQPIYAPFKQAVGSCYLNAGLKNKTCIMAKFEIKKSINGTFFFHFIATGHENISLKSEQYQSKSNCENGINSVKVNATDDRCYEKLTARDGRYYFNLKAANGEIIGTSPMFSGIADRDSNIILLKTQAPKASVADLT